MRNSLSVLLSSFSNYCFDVFVVPRSVFITSSVYPYSTVLLTIQAITDREGAFALVVSRGIYSLYRCNTLENGLGRAQRKTSFSWAGGGILTLIKQVSKPTHVNEVLFCQSSTLDSYSIHHLNSGHIIL